MIFARIRIIFAVYVYFGVCFCQVGPLVELRKQLSAIFMKGEMNWELYLNCTTADEDDWVVSCSIYHAEMMKERSKESECQKSQPV